MGRLPQEMRERIIVYYKELTASATPTILQRVGAYLLKTSDYGEKNVRLTQFNIAGHTLDDVMRKVDGMFKFERKNVDVGFIARGRVSRDYIYVAPKVPVVSPQS